MPSAGLIFPSSDVHLWPRRLWKPEGQGLSLLSLLSSGTPIQRRWCRTPGGLSGDPVPEGRVEKEEGAHLLLFQSGMRLHLLGSSSSLLCAIRI